MAVSSLQYTMGISSGFKVYILEGHHSPRDADRLRPFSNQAIPMYSLKRKQSPDTSQLPKRACPASSHIRGKVTSSPANLKSRQPASAPGTPKILGPNLSLEHVLKTFLPERRPLEAKEIQDDQPLALVTRKERNRETLVRPQQNRPSVITCVSKPKTAPPPDTSNPLRDGEQPSCPRSPDVEEHFQRSLLSCVPRSNHPSNHPAPSIPRLSAQSTSLSVEDHFSKALGNKWLLIRAAADSPSSSIPNRSRNPIL
ncbi:uncharacterized protein RCH25_004824 [Pelodytes ibericus]